MPKMIRPTCAEMANFLAQHNNKPFKIQDPDTEWTISIFNLVERNGAIWIVAEYEDMGPAEL